MQPRLRREANQSALKPRTLITQKTSRIEGNKDPVRYDLKNLFAVAVTLRVTSVFIVQTYFVPDEYWQSLEIAHGQVFGYGYKTWEWTQGIRGYTYPMVFTGVYTLLRIFHMDNAWLVIIIPRILQALLTAFSDISLYIFGKRIYGEKRATYAFALQLLSWFVFYTGSRTLTNTTEMALIIIGISVNNWAIFNAKLNAKDAEHFDQKNDGWKNLQCGILFCGLSCIIRPTAATTWLPIILYELYIDLFKRRSLRVFKYCILCVLVLFVASTAVDYLFYGRFIIVHFNFIKFNVMQGMSGFYGTHPWHWYFTQGIPVVLFTHLPLFLLGLYKMETHERPMALVMSVQLISLSLISHKEFRFLLPSMPFMICFAAKGLHKVIGEEILTYKPNETTLKDNIELNWFLRNKRRFVGLFVVLNAIAGLYTGLVHQRGTLDVMEFLRSDLKESSIDQSILFLMPCHSTPFYSHLHRNIPMRFLECHPSQDLGYIEEAERFYSNSTQWLYSEFSENRRLLPSHVVMFNVLLQDIGVAYFLRSNIYRQCCRFFHTHFPEGRIGKDAVVFCKS